MTRNTDELIQDLARDIRPVQVLPRPWVRAATWLAFSGVYIGVVMMWMTPPGRPSDWPEPRFVIEQVSALVLGLGASVAAFATVVPGHNRKLLAFLIIPLAGWLGSMGEGCFRSFNQIGPQALLLVHDLFCFPSIVLLGAFPTIAMAAMLRRGAPLTPRLTTALGALAAAGLANFFLRLFRPEDVTVMLVVWHVGGVFALSALAGGLGRLLLNWRWMTGRQ
ncbi:MAG: DUF1109 family protein [Acidobacteria bacterium]|nr:DUF1109 family protein [Acidobacteriota bacterium]